MTKATAAIAATIDLRMNDSSPGVTNAAHAIAARIPAQAARRHVDSMRGVGHGAPSLSTSDPRGLRAMPWGQVAEWLKAADCKSARVSVRWFESSPFHQFSDQKMSRGHFPENYGAQAKGKIDPIPPMLLGLIYLEQYIRRTDCPKLGSSTAYD